MSYRTGISFCEDVLMNSLKTDVINFITQELNNTRNNKEYRE